MAGDNIIEIDDTRFQSEVLASAQPVLVDFWATWCAPCRAIAPMLEELAGQYKGKVKVAKINVDDHQNAAQQFGVRHLPTLLMFKGGKVLEQIVGAPSKAKLDEVFKKAVS